MTRGTDANLAFVFTTPARAADPAPGIRAAPELGRYESIRRRLAIAAGAELRRRHPGQKIEPLRFAEPAPASDIERDVELHQTTTRIRDLAAQHHAFREKPASSSAG